MVEEAYCSFEVAKLLKEKGFPQKYDEYHSLVYNEEDFEDEYEIQRGVTQTDIIKAGTLLCYPLGVPEPKCYCPTHQMAMRWLREVYGIMINIVYKKIYADLGCSPQYIGYWHFNDRPYHSYEDAVESALKYCLEQLIEK